MEGGILCRLKSDEYFKNTIKDADNNENTVWLRLSRAST